MFFFFRGGGVPSYLKPMDLIIFILTAVVTKELPISTRFSPYELLSQCMFSTLTIRQPLVEFYLLTATYGRKNTDFVGKNRTHDFRTSRCADYLLDHSGDEGTVTNIK